MKNEKLVFTIDLGTGGPKVAISNTKGQIIAHAFRETPVELTDDGGAEQKTALWWDAICNASKEVLYKSSVKPENISAIASTAQWSGTVAVDKEGKALMNALIWMDSRGAEEVKRITKGFPKFEGYGLSKLLTWLRLTGGVPTQSGKDSIAHILYIQKNYPEIYNKTWKFLEPKDYINLKLTGEALATFDSITMHWLTDNRDINNIQYSDKLLRLSGVDREKCPDLVKATDIIGKLNRSAALDLGLPEGIPVIGGTPDLHSAALGSGAVKDFEGHLYIGTSSWMLAHVPWKKTDIFHNMASLPSPLPGRYLYSNEQESAGNCLTWMKDNVLFHADDLAEEANCANAYEFMDKICQSTKAGAGKVLFSPWLYGERTPVEDHTLRGGFHNMSLKTTHNDLIRSVFEGVAFNSRWLMLHLEKGLKHQFPHLNFIGGGANSDIWSQIYADILNRPIR
ncbi:MAG: FGGY-family carbohydrate kinase, partial [Candidatus Marinimicrobia bacterium]|nr:FGGY-family carbohydrate kinase [Candidatus Neomarinimicrobiota bacterium]